MRKIISFSLCLILLILSLCSCSSNKTQQKATIVDSDGNTVQMSAKEIMSVYKENQAKFDSLYKGADITFVGTVKSVSTNVVNNGSDTATDVIYFKDGWEVYLPHAVYTKQLEKLSEGTKVQVQSNIFSAFGLSVDIRGMDTSTAVKGYTKESLNKTILSIIE